MVHRRRRGRISLGTDHYHDPARHSCRLRPQAAQSPTGGVCAAPTGLRTAVSTSAAVRRTAASRGAAGSYRTAVRRTPASEFVRPAAAPRPVAGVGAPRALACTLEHSRDDAVRGFLGRRRSSRRCGILHGRQDHRESRSDMHSWPRVLRPSRTHFSYASRASMVVSRQPSSITPKRRRESSSQESPP